MTTTEHIATAAERGYLAPKGRQQRAELCTYEQWCTRTMHPAIIVRHDGPRHERIELDLEPLGHVMTEATWEAVCAYLRTVADLGHLRRDAPWMLSTPSYVSCRRIPRDALEGVVAQLRALLDPPGALTFDHRETLFGMRLAKVRGLAWSWAFVDTLPSGDYRAELREE